MQTAKLNVVILLATRTQISAELTKIVKFHKTHKIQILVLTRDKDKIGQAGGDGGGGGEEGGGEEKVDPGGEEKGGGGEEEDLGGEGGRCESRCDQESKH